MSFFRRKSVLKWLVYGVFAVVLLVLQSSRTPGLTLWSARADFLPFLVTALALYEGPYLAGTMGFFSGLLLAIHGVTIEGLACLYLSLVGVVLGWLFDKYFRVNILLPILSGAMSLLFAEICKYVFYYRLVHRLSIGLGALTAVGALALSVPVGVAVCYATRWLSRFFGEDEQ
ncbi:MAG: rod shape-determining protein MreD [Clostridia bacterium]|nr:rod shape-determining protein MreD [Clostridia bacterium]